MAEFTSVFGACFERRSFGLVRNVLLFFIQRYEKVGFAVRLVPYFIECGEERFGEDRERIWSVPDFRRLYGR